MTSVEEYGSEIDQTGPSLQDTKGSFSYSVGTHFQGLLLSSAASATTVDNSTRHHSKMDNSQYTYAGRSYGIGASVGLVDDSILNNDLATAYRCRDTGYDTRVVCI
jgi:hypothetical protein